MHSSGPVGRHRQLVMVLEGELYLIPFALLKGSSSNEYLYERFSLIAIPSIQGLGSNAKVGLLFHRIMLHFHLKLRDEYFNYPQFLPFQCPTT